MSERANQPVVDFTIRCHPRSRLKYRVQVFEALSDLEAWCKENCGSYTNGLYSDGAQGICHSYQLIGIAEDGTETLSREIGTIHYHLGFLGCGVMTHELVHAALNAYGRKHRSKEGTVAIPSGSGNGLVSQREEWLCHSVSYMAFRVNKVFHAKSIWERAKVRQ